MYIYMAEQLRAANNPYMHTYEYIYTHTLTFIYVCIYVYLYLKVAEELGRANLEVEVDLSANMLNKKIRTAQLAQFNYILVVGKEEVDIFYFWPTLTVYMSTYCYVCVLTTAPYYCTLQASNATVNVRALNHI